MQPLYQLDYRWAIYIAGKLVCVNQYLQEFTVVKV